MGNYKLLDEISYPKDLKNLTIDELRILADELRAETVAIVSKTGGHLGAGLGVIELTLALHYIFNTPNDKLIWDVGHQSYPHKIITGRRDKMLTIRKKDGLSGFAKIKESEYDAFGAGHSSTSISAGIGMLVANYHKQEKVNIIPIIGDGAISAGLAYEALNNAGGLPSHYFKDSKFITILNDNEMSISAPTGAMSNYLSRMVSSKSYLKFREISKKIFKKLPFAVGQITKTIEKSVKKIGAGESNIFEEMGFYYIGPIDGHDIELLTSILKNIKEDDNLTKPILLHIITKKGYGYDLIKSSDKLHAVTEFDHKTGEIKKKNTDAVSYSKIFGKRLSILAQTDKNIIAITAAMPTGTGLEEFKHTDRLYDVAIAEQHAVTFAAGASFKLKPFVAIYSTFLQRAYDQVVHDVAIQNLPVKFAIDRAGYVGADGPTHAGSFDIAYLINLPNFVLIAPSNGQDLIKAINSANQINQPVAFRYPRAECKDILDLHDDSILAFGKSKIIKNGSEIAVIACGTIIENALKTADIIKEKYEKDITVVDAIFLKPFDKELILELAKTHKLIITIEEGAIGGYGSVINNYLNEVGFGLDSFEHLNSSEKIDISAKKDYSENLNSFEKLEEIEIYSQNKENSDVIDNKKEGSKEQKVSEKINKNNKDLGNISCENFKFISLFMEDKFIDQKPIEAMRVEGGLGTDRIVEVIEKWLKANSK